MPNPPKYTRGAQIGQPLRFFNVSAAAATGVNDANGNPVQWTYTVNEVHKLATGYGAWTARAAADGYTGTGYNFNEISNQTSGRQGNGIDHDGADYPSAFSMQPLQSGYIYPAMLVAAPDGTGIKLEAWLWGMNGEDGTC